MSVVQFPSLLVKQNDKCIKLHCVESKVPNYFLPACYFQSLIKYEIYFNHVQRYRTSYGPGLGY